MKNHSIVDLEGAFLIAQCSPLILQTGRLRPGDVLKIVSKVMAQGGLQSTAFKDGGASVRCLLFYKREADKRKKVPGQKSEGNNNYRASAEL